MIQIIPAILDKTPEDFGKHIAQLKHSGSFQEGWVHIDLTDNAFVQNQTISIDTVIRNPTSLKKEAHLMVVHPLAWLDKLNEAGFKRVFLHLESKDDILECINRIKELGMEAGIAINIDTPIEKLEPFKDKIDIILMMSVVPGFQGQPFLPEALTKIKLLKEKNWPIKIAIDGAISAINVKQIVDAGVDQLIIGSYLLNGDLDENLETLWEKINE